MKLLKSVKYLLSNSLSISIILIMWEIAAQNNWIQALYFPPPSKIAVRLFHLLLHDPSFLKDIYASTYRLMMGAIIGIPPAIILSLGIYLNRHIASFFNPLIAVTYPVPKLAVFPLLLIIFGIGDASKIAIIALGIFFLVLLDTTHGLKRILSTEYADIISIYKIPFWHKLFHIMIKGTLPEILNGIKMGMGYGLVMVVAGEFTVSRNGLGFLMWNAWDQFRILDIYCGLVLLSFTGLIIFIAFDKLKSNLKVFASEHNSDVD